MININIKATGLELTGAIKSYLEEKLAHLEKFMGSQAKTASAQVEIGKETKHHKQGELFRAEVNLNLGRHRFRAEVTESDLYAAIDKVKDELARELKSSRGKIEDLGKRGGRKIKAILKGN